jgi:hypothetical protein
MKLQFPFATLLALASSSPLAVRGPEHVMSENPALSARKGLEERDVWCKVQYSPPTDSIVCMLQPDIDSQFVRDVYTSDKFGVSCKEPGLDSNP